MCRKGSLAIAAAAAIVVGLLFSQLCELNCAFFGCSDPVPAIVAKHRAPAEHCHGHHAPEPESIPTDNHHSPGCQHQHLALAAPLPAGVQLGVAMNLALAAVADLTHIQAAGYDGPTMVTARGAPFRSPPARAVTSSVLRI